MKNRSDLRQILLAYKLGELPDAEREQLDERILVDQDFSEQLAEAEYDLLDDYRANRLNYRQRRRVERAFPPSQLKRRLVSTSAASPGATQNPSHAGFLSWFPLPLSVAALLVLVGTEWFVSSHRRTQNPMQRVQSQPVPQAHPATLPASNTEAGDHRASGAEARNIALLVLGSSVMRGGTTSILKMNPSVSSVHVQWIVPAECPARSFRLSLVRNGALLQRIGQRGEIQEIDGNSIVEFNLAPSIFAHVADGTHFLFVIDANESSHATLGEYPVALQQK